MVGAKRSREGGGASEVKNSLVIRGARSGSGVQYHFAEKSTLGVKEGPQPGKTGEERQQNDQGHSRN